MEDLKMDTQEFYAGLKKEDRERVEAVVTALKSGGLQVYASHLMGYLIPDLEISLSATPSKGMTRGDVQHSVDDVVRQFHGQEVREAASKSLRGRMFLNSYVIVDEPQPLTPSEIDAIGALNEYLGKFNPPGKKCDSRTEDLIPQKKEQYDIPLIKPLINKFDLSKDLSFPKRKSFYEKDENTAPEDLGMTSLSKELERLLGEFQKPNRDYKEKYTPLNPTPPSKFKEFEHLDKMPPMAIEKTILTEQPTREPRYRIGTIGETPIEVRVSYKPIDALSKLIKVEL